MPTHTFEGTLAWERGGEGVAVSNHGVTFAGRPTIEVSAAPQYKGDPSRVNPEELLTAAIASCQCLTYLALAGRAGIAVVRYDDRPIGTLAIADRKMRVTSVQLRPRITVAAGSDIDKARALVEAAHDGCFIANSVTATVQVDPEIIVEG